MKDAPNIQKVSGKIDKMFADITSAMADRASMVSSINAGESEATIAKFEDAVKRHATGQEKAQFMAASMDVPKAAYLAKQKEVDGAMLATVAGPPIIATPFHKGIARNFVMLKVLDPDETLEYESENDTHSVAWTGEGGSARHVEITYGRSSISVYPLRTDNTMILDTELSRRVWDAKANIRARLTEAMDKKEDSYFMELVRTAALSTNSATDDHMVSRSGNAFNQDDMMTLLKILTPHGGARAVLMGEDPMYNMLQWGITDSYNTLFTPETREQMVVTGKIGSIGGAAIIYNDIVTSDSSTYKYYVYAFVEKQRVGYLAMRPIDGMVRKTGTAFDYVTDKHLFWQKEQLGMAIANVYGCAVSTE